MASAFDLVTRGGALVEGGGEGGGRLEAELENISSTLQERVFGLVEGYHRLHELAAYGPGLVQKAATRVAEAAMSADTAEAGSASPSWPRRRRAFNETSAAEREQLLSNLFLLHEERLAVERAISQDGLPSVEAERVGVSGRVRGRQAHAVAASASRAREGGSRAGGRGEEAWLLRTDRPLPIPTYPTSRSTPPTAALAAAGGSVPVPSYGADKRSGADELRGVPLAKKAQLEHGYTLPPEVQASLVFLPKPDPSALRRSSGTGPSTRPPRTRSPARQSVGATGLSHLLEDLPVVLRQQRLLAGLRTKVSEVERKGQASTSSLAAVYKLLKEQEQRQKEVESELKHLTDQLAQQQPRPPSRSPPPTPPTHDHDAQPPGPSPAAPLEATQEEEAEEEAGSRSCYRVLQPRRTAAAPPTPQPAPPVVVSSTAPCISVEGGAQVELLFVSQHGPRTEVLADGRPAMGGSQTSAEEEEEEEEEEELRSLSEGRPVLMQGEGQGSDWWERMEAVGWLRDAHRSSSSQVVEIKRAMDSAVMFRRLQEILLDELGPLLVPAEQRAEEVEPEPPAALDEISVPPPPAQEEGVVAALQPAPVPDRHTLDEEELALRLAAERTRWELERERELSAEKDKHLEAALAREARERAQLDGCMALLTDLTHRVTTIETNKAEPPPPPPPVEPPPPLVIQVPAPAPVQAAQEARQRVSRAMQTVQGSQTMPPPPPSRLPSGPAEALEVVEQGAITTHDSASPGTWDEADDDVSQLSSREDAHTNFSGRRVVPPSSPPSTPGSSASEGQVYLDETSSQVSEGQLTRHYRHHRRRDGRGGGAAAAAVRSEGWRSPGRNTLPTGEDWTLEKLQDSLDEMLSDARHKEGRDGHDGDGSPTPPRMPVRLLRWRNA